MRSLQMLKNITFNLCIFNWRYFNKSWVQLRFLYVWSIKFYLFNYIGFHGLFHVISGEVCYAGEGSIGTYTWRWFSNTGDPCQCTRLEFAGINVDKVRGMVQVSCPMPGEFVYLFELQILKNWCKRKKTQCYL